MMQKIDILNHRGLHTISALPPVGTAKALQNFVRHKLYGALQFSRGYNTKKYQPIAFTSITAGTPVVVNTTQPHKLMSGLYVQIDTGSGYSTIYQITVSGPSEIELDGTSGGAAGAGNLRVVSVPQNDAGLPKLSNLTLVDLKTVYVPEHGGREITMVVGTQTKGSYAVSAPVDVDQFCAWINPWWDGTRWIEGWQELTEFWQFEIRGFGNAIDGDEMQVYVDHYDGANWDVNFRSLDPDQIYFKYNANATPDPDDYFKGWVIRYGSEDTQNYDTVIRSGYAGSDSGGDTFYFAVPHLTATYASRIIGTPITVFRNFFKNGIPSTADPYVIRLFNELRITTGNAATDLQAYVGNKTASLANLPLSYNGAFDNYTGKTLDGIYCGDAGMDHWKYAVIVEMLDGSTPASGPPSDTYYFKYALVREDGQVGALFTDGCTKTLTSTFNHELKCYVKRSLGALPKWAKYLRVFISTDQAAYFSVKDIDLTLDDNFTTGTIGVTSFVNDAGDTIEHCYAGTDVTKTYISAADWAAIGAEATADIGRAATDTGALPHKVRAIVGNKSFIADVTVAGVRVPNKVYRSVSNGAGNMQYDVHANDPQKIIDLEYNDGDEIVGIVPTTADRFVVVKRKTAVLCEPNGEGYSRIVISSNIGLTAQKAIAVEDARSFWPDYNGLMMFSPNGPEVINASWLEDWKSISAEDKEAAFSVIDPVNKKWLLYVAGKVYSYGFMDKEWTVEVLSDVPVAAAQNTDLPTGIEILKDNIYTMEDGVLMDGASIAASWESNKIEPLLETEAGNFAEDIVPQYLYLEYEANVAVTVQLYLDDSVAVWGSAYTLDTAKVKANVPFALGARCKGFRYKLSATKAADANAVTIKKAVLYYSRIKTTRYAQGV